MVNPSFKPVRSLQRGLRLLEVVSGSRDGVILKDLAATVGCSPAATYHLIHTLYDAGFVRRLENPVRYVLGDSLRRLVGNQQNDTFYAVAHACMKRFHQALPEVSIYFSEFMGGDVVVTATLLPKISKQVIRETRPRVLPAYASAGSVAHYAFWSPETVEDYQARYSFIAYGIPFWGRVATFDKAVTRLRRDRLLVMPKAGKSNVKVALPLFDPEGGLVAAFTLQWNCATPRNVDQRRAQLVSKAQWISEQFTKNLSL